MQTHWAFLQNSLQQANEQRRHQSPSLRPPSFLLSYVPEKVACDQHGRGLLWLPVPAWALLGKSPPGASSYPPVAYDAWRPGRVPPRPCPRRSPCRPRSSTHPSREENPHLPNGARARRVGGSPGDEGYIAAVLSKALKNINDG